MKLKKTLVNLLVPAVLFAGSLNSKASECIKPKAGMKITQDTVFCEGDYQINSPIEINSGVVVDCNNSVLSGDYWHIFDIRSSNSIIRNGTFENSNQCINSSKEIDNILLDNLTFINNNYGVHVDSSITISNCVFLNNITAIAVSGDDLYYPSNSTYIYDNFIKNNETGIISGAKHTELIGNFMRDNVHNLDFCFGEGRTLNYILNYWGSVDCDEIDSKIRALDCIPIDMQANSTEFDFEPFLNENMEGMQCPCDCVGDLNGDGWKSPADISGLVSILLPEKSSQYWLNVPINHCGDINKDDWLSPIDVSALTSQILPYSSDNYWKQCE